MSSMTPLEKAAQRSRHLLPLVAIALIGCLGGCEYESDDVSLPSASFPTTEARTVPPLPDSGDSTVPPLPRVATSTPAPTSSPASRSLSRSPSQTAGASDGDGLGKDDPDHPGEGAVFVTFWPADYVPTDACAWKGALVEVDPSAEAFVEAMTAQTSTASTPPVKVMVGDYSGFEFDHSVEGDVDITACDGDKFCIHSESSYECTRWYSTRMSAKPTGWST